MVGHERLAVVLADVAVDAESGLASQVAVELPGVVVLDDDRAPRPADRVDDRLRVEGHDPANRELVGGDALVGQLLDGLPDHAFGRAPADQGDICILRAL